MQYKSEKVEPVTSDRLAKRALIGSCAVTVVYALTSLALPFGWDHGIMASVGSSYVHGNLPYVDAWDMKGPAAYLPYALVQFLFGPTMWGIRIFDVIISAGALLVFYEGLRALTSCRVAAWASLSLYYWIAAAGWFFTAVPESWTDLLVAMAIVPLLSPNKTLGNRRLFLSGLLIGCVGLIKPVYLGVGAAPLLTIALTQDLEFRQRAALAVSLAAGAAAPILLIFGYFAWRGSISQAIEVHILYPLSTYARAQGISPFRSAVVGFADFFARPTVALIAPFVALGIWTTRNQRYVLWPSLAWVAVTVLSVVLQGKYFFYHWFPTYAPLVFLAALGAHALAKIRGGPPLILTLGAALAFAGQVCALPFYDAAKCIYYLAVKRAPESYYASYQFNADAVVDRRTYNAADELAAARYIEARTKPDDGVFVWGNDATVPYLANRPNPSRFTFEMPLSLQGPYLARYRAEALNQLRTRPPAYFVLGINWWSSDTKEQSIAKFPELASFLAKSYSREKSFGILDLYRRNESAE